MYKRPTRFLALIALCALTASPLIAAEKRIKDLNTTATSPNSDDYMALDGATKGTRKILANTLAPTISGGAATYGNATHTANITVDANGKISAVTVTAIAAGSGNVTNNATLTDGRLVLGGGTSVVGITGAATHGQLYIGNTTNGNMQLNTLTAGDGITITNAAGSITINSTAGGGNVTGGGLTANAVIVGGGSNAVAPLASLGTSGHPLVSAGAGAPPAFGVLGVAGGGTGIASGTSGGVPYYSGSTTIASSGALAAGNIVVGGGAGAAPLTRAVSIDASANIVTAGNITANIITGNNLTVTDFVTTNFTVSGNLASSTVADGQIYIGDNADNRLELATITAGNGITITNGAGAITVTQKGRIREQFLTIDDLADSLNYGLYYTTDAITIVGIKGVHTGSGLSSPSIIATLKHGTDRTSGTTIEAVTVTSSTTGTADDGTLSDATVPAGSWIWVETSGKSGTTDNFELVIRYTHD
jgi:hypothetical protein